MQLLVAASLDHMGSKAKFEIIGIGKCFFNKPDHCFDIDAAGVDSPADKHGRSR